jgi:hypothetical protein
MKKYNTYNIVLEIPSVVLSIVFSKYLKNIDFIFLYKYLLLVSFLLVLIFLKIKLNDKIMKIIFYLNLLIVSTYYIVNLILYYCEIG